MHIFYQVFKQLYEKKLILISNFRKSKTNKNCGFQNYVLHSLQNQTISLYWCQTKIAKCFIIVHIPLIIRQINIVDKILTCKDIKSKMGFIGQLLRHKNCCNYSLAVINLNASNNATFFRKRNEGFTRKKQTPTDYCISFCLKRKDSLLIFTDRR